MSALLLFLTVLSRIGCINGVVGVVFFLSLFVVFFSCVGVGVVAYLGFDGVVQVHSGGWVVVGCFATVALQGLLHVSVVVLLPWLVLLFVLVMLSAVAVVVRVVGFVVLVGSSVSGRRWC